MQIPVYKKVFPNTETGAKDYLKADSTYKKSDIDKAKVIRDPFVQGVFALDFPDNETRVIVYLAGYKEPFGNIRDSNDFESGEIPDKERE